MQENGQVQPEDGLMMDFPYPINHLQLTPNDGIQPWDQVGNGRG